jgi:hypothetical protein
LRRCVTVRHADATRACITRHVRERRV